jgi:ligand-binding sensor domain-containing protein
MKCEHDSVVWQVGSFGVYRYSSDSLHRFTNLHSAHDICFKDDTVVIADRHGLKFFDRQSSSPIKTLFPEVSFWFAEMFGDTLVAGGRSLVLIDNTSEIRIDLSVENNTIWDIVRADDTTFYCATQNGLYRYRPYQKRMTCIGYKGKCVKSLYIDHRGSMWVGEYF